MKQEFKSTAVAAAIRNSENWKLEAFARSETGERVEIMATKWGFESAVIHVPDRESQNLGIQRRVYLYHGVEWQAVAQKDFENIASAIDAKPIILPDTRWMFAGGAGK